MSNTIRAAPSQRRPAAMEKGRLALLASLAVLTIGAWAVTIHQARTMSMPMGVAVTGAGDAAGMAGMPGMAVSGMAGAGWSWDGAGTFVIAWAVMMAAMMFPAAAPMLLLFRAVHAKRNGAGGAVVPTWVFAAGYLLVWTAAGAMTWVLIRSISDLAGRLDTGSRVTWGPLALGAVLIVAGLYQVTPLKRICLDRCRSPFGFVMGHWKEGYRGALRMGVIHGGYCLGCCWALFAVLVAAGVMSLAWMALLTLIVFAEKTLPLGRRAPAVAGAAFLIMGILVAARAMDLPWTV